LNSVSPKDGSPSQKLHKLHFYIHFSASLMLKTETFYELKRSIEELNSEFERNYQTLTNLIKELNAITDELASVHKNTTMGSLAGTVMGAAGGVTTLAGLALSPFTFGASLALTAVGVAAGVAGGATGATFSITNMIKQKNLRQTIEKIINDFQNTINPMIQLLSAISNSTEVIEQLEKQMFKQQEGAEAVRGAAHLLKIAYVAEVAQIGKACAEAAKAFHAAAKTVHMAVAITGALSALFLALDVVGIVQDFTEISEMKQPADERKAEDIKSETLKYPKESNQLVEHGHPMTPLNLCYFSVFVFYKCTCFANKHLNHVLWNYK
uniref:Uncharacterized protein n=1 Tax=Sinocyclocheilus anshuiensis TaxID=1608454 RepID=A0A671TDU2_9TELE